MEKNYAMRISAIFLILTMTSLCMVSRTFAKCAVEASGSDTATVAKFSVKLGSEDIAKSDSITVNLFKNSYLDGKVKGDSDKLVVAPGTSGYFKIATKNEGDIAVKTSFTLSETNNGNIPIEYAVTESTAEPASDAWKTATELLSQKISEQNLAVGATGTTKYLHWKWITPDGSGDATDTAIGMAASPATVTTTITCVAEQDTGA